MKRRQAKKSQEKNRFSIYIVNRCKNTRRRRQYLNTVPACFATRIFKSSLASKLSNLKTIDPCRKRRFFSSWKLHTILEITSGNVFRQRFALNDFLFLYCCLLIQLQQRVPNFRNSFRVKHEEEQASGTWKYKNVFSNKSRNVMKSTEMEMRPRETTARAFVLRKDQEEDKLLFYFSEKWAPQFLECTFFFFRKQG